MPPDSEFPPGPQVTHDSDVPSGAGPGAVSGADVPSGPGASPCPPAPGPDAAAGAGTFAGAGSVPGSGASRDAGAALLSEALNAVAAHHRRVAGPGELPGEEVAVAAFLRARAEAAAGGVPAARRRRPRWSLGWAQPLRAGLAVVIAGGALCGVAVAAGTGVLPTPFGDRGRPVPATSVSGAESAEPLRSGPPLAEDSAATAREPGRADAASPAPSGPLGTEPGSGTPSHGDRGDGPGPSPSERPSDAPDLPDAKPSHRGGGPETARLARSWCRKYKAGTVDKQALRWLEDVAGGAKGVNRYCGKVLADEPEQGSDGGEAPKTPPVRKNVPTRSSLDIGLGEGQGEGQGSGQGLVR
ncbi:hypothetical protein [Streptomyces sp. URMC 123]|uniref:hypothetical protein n=1 Tax=Streptomyces sp. URMC 123 TaxID=3423403 RepID=UPI003F1DE4CB